MFREARVARRLTLEYVAEQVGVTPGALSHIESGRRLPTPSNAVAIGAVLGIVPDVVMAELDSDHSRRRYESLERSDGVVRTPAYSARPIEDLFGEPSANLASPEPGFESHALRTPVHGRSSRDMARWSPSSVARLQALSELSDSAAEAIRTLRGALEDEDPAIRREARRLLRELDVRLPEE